MVSIRTLIFTSLIFLFSIIVLSFNTLSFNFLGIDFDRGDSGTIFGLTLGLDLKGGTHLVYQAIPNKNREISNEDMEGARKILERRVNSFGISELENCKSHKLEMWNRKIGNRKSTSCNRYFRSR